MKKILFIVILLSGVISLPSYAQESLRQMRSTIIEKVNGKEFYIHTVKRGQTLYMIAKAYEADINEIIQENPEVREGIKSGQKIRIPAHGTTESPKKQTKAIPEDIKQTAKSKDEESLPCGKDKSSMKFKFLIHIQVKMNQNF